MPKKIICALSVALGLASAPDPDHRARCHAGSVQRGLYHFVSEFL